MRFIMFLILSAGLLTGAISSAHAGEASPFRASCAEYSALFSVVAGESRQAMAQETVDFSSLSGLMIGYVSGLQDLTGIRIIRPEEGRTEWALLSELNSVCTRTPSRDLAGAIRQVAGRDDILKMFLKREKCSGSP